MFRDRRILSLVFNYFERSGKVCHLTGCPGICILKLATQAETADDLVVTLYVLALQVIQQTPALRDHLEQAAPRMVIFLVRLEMLGQLVNALAEQCNLHLW